MVPILTYSLSGLQPDVNYAVLVEFRRADNCLYKFKKGRWQTVGEESVPPQADPRQSIVHNWSPAPGHTWMQQPVCFDNVRLTHILHDPSTYVSVHILCLCVHCVHSCRYYSNVIANMHHV
jgi:hypothetical protein